MIQMVEGRHVVDRFGRSELANKFRQRLRDLRTGRFASVPLYLNEDELQSAIIVLEHPRVLP